LKTCWNLYSLKRWTNVWLQEKLCPSRSRKCLSFRVLFTDTAFVVHNVGAIILARCVLHNCLRRKSAKYSPNTRVDEADMESRQLTPGQRRENGIQWLHCNGTHEQALT
jgi:hypothetical protein